VGADALLFAVVDRAQVDDLFQAAPAALALDLRRPQDYFQRVWNIGFRATELASAGAGADPVPDDDQPGADGDELEATA
jgi:hypothetical protein